MSYKLTNNAWATLAVALNNSATTVQVTLAAGQGARWPSLNSANVTITNASPAVVTWTAHGLVANQAVVFNTNGGSIPTGLTAGVAYYIVGSSILTNSFQVSATINGAAINTSSNQSGTVTGSSDWTYSTLQNAGGAIEVVKVTSISGDVLQVVRGWDGTSVQTWAIADRFEDRPCAAAMNDKLTVADASITYAALASPTFTGTPTLPTGTIATTQASTDSSTKLATTAYVQSQWTTGDIKVTLKTAADAGWILVNDGSIGNGASSATTRANADTAALFTLIWTNVINTWAPTQDSSGSPVARGISAAADYAANRRIVLPKALGRALAVAGAGSGLTSRALGQILGNEGQPITQANLPNVSFPVSDPTHAHIISPTAAQVSGGYTPGGNANAAIPGAAQTAASATGITVSSGGSDTLLPIMQPSTFVNIMVKL